MTVLEDLAGLGDLGGLDFVQPMPGFPDCRSFALVRLDDDGVLCELRSLERPEVRFLVVPPAPFFPDYAPEVSDEVVAELEIGSADDVVVLLVLNAGGSLEDTTANLLAPVLVNTATRRAGQVILEDATLPLAAPLLAPAFA
ncbi:MAG: flagellar assembly protein FliW [Nocardioidaceae bacterium]|nr:flagellar assembly protein FliW [Nocardioidaceae bacterium]